MREIRVISEGWLVPVTRLSQTTSNGEFLIQDAFERKCMCGDASHSFAIPQLFYLYSYGDQLARIPILSTQLTVYDTLTTPAVKSLEGKAWMHAGHGFAVLAQILNIFKSIGFKP